MRTLIKSLLSLLLASSFFTSFVVAAEGGVVIIVNTKNSQPLTKQQVKNIYSDNTITWENGKKITVFHLPVDSTAREKFSQSIFGESAQKQASAELNRKITNTIKNPTKTKRARLVEKMVSRNLDAIGYIPEEFVVKINNIRKILTIQ